LKFWDASAVVPLLLDQTQTRFAAGKREEDPSMLVWWATPVECTSALCHLERESRLSNDQIDAALANLRGLAGTWYEIQPSRSLKVRAQRLLRVHALRAADSLQLAAALVAADEEPESVEFLSFDEQLNRAAAREGFSVVTS